jgi:hypothetical protein
MTYWATLWYAGAVVMQLGSEGQTLNNCEMLTRLMISDIERSYADPTLKAQLDTTMFPTNEFTVTCETKKLATDELYAK